VLTEAAAILAWLGAAYGEEGYARETRLGRKEAEALAYMTSEVHAAYGGHFNTRKFAESEAAQQEVKRKTYENLAVHYQRMNKNLEQNGGNWYLGQRSFADTFLYVLTRWIEKTPLSIDDYPALQAYRSRMEADAGVRQALARQDMEPIA
jgi:glutathione S-transferase